MKTIFTLVLLIIITQTFGQPLKDCSVCAIQIIKNEQIKDLSIDEIRLLTNDLFARKGYKFKSADVDNYYSTIKWYKPILDNNKIVYNETEKQNIKLFQDRTTELKNERNEMILKLKELKYDLSLNDKEILKRKYGYSADKDYADEYKYLTEAFSKINFDDINWSFGVGMHKLTIDNGDIVMNYEIQIKPTGISINYANQGGSKIAKQLYPNDEITEFSFWWEFEWKDNKIKFLKLVMAG